MEQINEKQLISKVSLRLVPFVMALYILSYIDRVNVGFAALTMNKAIGLDAAAYGFGAGVFFWGYVLCEVPSNVILHKVGARKWIARILLTWGIVSTGMAFVQGPYSFYVMRFLLGAAEAGFFPGVILYLTYWFPARYRAQIIARFMIAIPLALAIGAPLSMLIMQLDGTFGFQGWQWMFIVEGIPAVLAPIAVWKLMPNNPNEAEWLTDAEKQWLTNEVSSDVENLAHKKTETTAGALTNPILWVFGLMYMGTNATNLGLSMFLPQIIKESGFSMVQTGFIMSIPYIVGCLGMLAIGYSSDRYKERKWHTAGALFLAGLGLAVAGYAGSSVIAIAALAFAAVGFLGAKSPLFALASGQMSGTGAAAGIALINSIGNLGGFIGPWSVGLTKNMTGTFSGGLYGLALIGFSAAVLTVIVVRVKRNKPV